MTKKSKSIKVLQSLVTTVDLCNAEWWLGSNKKQNSAHWKPILTFILLFQTSHVWSPLPHILITHPFVMSSHHKEHTVPNFGMHKDTCNVEPFLWGWTQKMDTEQNTLLVPLLHKLQCCCLLPEGTTKLQEPFQHFLPRFLFGVPASSQLQQEIPNGLWHSNLSTGICW